jgi:hypothetical protein
MIEKDEGAGISDGEIEITVTPEMIDTASEVDMRSSDYTEDRVRSAAEVFAAILFSLPEGSRMGIKSVRAGGEVWRCLDEVREY